MLSVVIPTLNAASDLPDTLDRMRTADEIVVADGGSTDQTARVAERCGARLILAPKGRGAQLAAGAEAARGDWLLFLHADTVPGPRWRAAVDAHIAAAPGKAACFRFRLADRAWQARWIERGVAARVRLLALPYGDQGLLVPRALYEAVGGYRPLPLMEDVELVRRLGRSRLSLLEETASTSSARWRRDGWLSRSARNLACLALYRLGASPERIARLYG
ncbi:MAG TPA: TIGR04283 family arsenosugar biosynthesis glycosyltransferase [Allosphingosinicella sp.]|nr:TIGR04283 family arsenosugar biosynthesis glycosyltransferase [Allosphingosinicella sp.]